MACSLLMKMVRPAGVRVGVRVRVRVKVKVRVRIRVRVRWASQMW
jgi:hypothetical protein